MPVGHTAHLIECQTSPSYMVSVPPCVDIAGQFYQPVIVEGYVIEATSESYFEGLAQPFDYGLASQFFAFGFTGVVLLWWVGLVGGKIIQTIWH